MNNGQILYLYDAKLTNPNGDPDEENRPRMDYERSLNLVSDLRLKRYIRDFLIDKGYPLYVEKVDGESVTASARMKKFAADNKLDIEKIKDEFIDIRLFGATIPYKKDNKALTGPVQFNWGYSLNKVELLESSITSHFASSEGNKQGAIGKDYRVKYSMIAFSGVISAKRGTHTNLLN
jgi:CRISPR-associated protein Csh2